MSYIVKYDENGKQYLEHEFEQYPSKILILKILIFFISLIERIIPEEKFTKREHRLK
jgi:hypothetical protein